MGIRGRPESVQSVPWTTVPRYLTLKDRSAALDRERVDDEQMDFRCVPLKRISY